jgi:hypothetical protein
MTLTIVLALVAFVWLTDARAGFEDPVTADSTKQWTLWGYFYDPDGWAVYEDGLTKPIGQSASRQKKGRLPKVLRAARDRRPAIYM